MMQNTPDWVLRLRALSDQPPLRERVPLTWGGIEIGDAEPAVLQQIERAFSYQRATVLRKEPHGWRIDGNLTESMARIALVMRDLKLTHVWRNEQLPVLDSRSSALGTIERAAVRPLGLSTRAVHLVGETSDGQFWIQQRAMTKANDPGLWDTLMGGMVSAVDTVETALERETFEEAGLQLHSLFGLPTGDSCRFIVRPRIWGVALRRAASFASASTGIARRFPPIACRKTKTVKSSASPKCRVSR